jgi:hypothetical protein
MPGRGNEKPDAESTVKAVQRRFATPVPHAADLDDLNRSLRVRCEAERDRVVRSITGPFTIRDRLADDLAAAAPLPAHRFDACVIRPAVAVDKYQTVAFDNSRYSVPRPFAFELVTVKGYVDRVVIAARGQAVASHPRRPGEPMVLEPTHYLAALDRRPGALDHAPVFRDWRLPACFAAFRAELEAHHGAVAGSRRFARVLQLLGDHPLRRVSQAIEACRDEHLFSAEAVIQRARSLAAIEAATGDVAATPADVPAAPQVHVPRPDLSRFDQLLGGPAEDLVSVILA